MKKLFTKAVALALTATLAVGMAAPASAAFADFDDVRGHWAEATLEKAYNDGILKGYHTWAMAPDNSLTTAEAVTILTRVLHVSGAGDVSGFDIPAGAWYQDSVAKGVYAGLLDDSFGKELNQPILRGDAFRLFGRAFQTNGADPDMSVLAQFPDAAYLTGETKEAAASLIQDGIVNGSEGKLQADRSLTRAEFATILYRLVGKYATQATYADDTTTGTVLSGDVSLTGKQAGDLWLDDSAANIALTDTSAALLAVRADKLASLTLEGTGAIQELILAPRTGDVDLTLPETYAVDTLTVGQGSGDVKVAGSLGAVEVTGSGREILIHDENGLASLAVSGDNNTITLQKGTTVGDIVIRGENNTVKLGGSVDTLLLAGRDNTISGSGRVGDVTLQTKYYKLNVPKNNLTKWTGYDMKNVTAALTAPAHLPAGQVLAATADLTVPQEQTGKLCTAEWYLNGVLKQTTPFILGQETPVSAITPDYVHNMDPKGKVELVVTHVDNDGDKYQVKANTTVTMDNFSDLGLADAVVKVTVPQTLAAGEKLQATAVVETPETGKVCQGIWYVDGKEVAKETVTLGETTPTLSYPYDYYYGMPETSTVELALTYTTQDGRNQEVRGSADLKLENFPDNGIAKATAILQGPKVLEPGAVLNVTADVKYLEAGKTCSAAWYVDGQKVSEQTVTLGTDTPSMSHTYTYSEKMKLTSEIKLVLSYTTQDGRAQQVVGTTTIPLKNYGYLYYHGMTEADVLNAVTSTYAGNYTLQWALNNDYDPELKTAWVNLKGYSSNTDYLVWVNLTYQRVNIFKGSQGNWELIRECLCGSGTNATPTIKGVFTTSYKQHSWNYGSYYCGPIVRFYGTSGYAFHSRLEYWPMNSDRYYDARIGFPISHGCLRMYNDDIWFMYDNIPNGTTVVVH